MNPTGRKTATMAKVGRHDGQADLIEAFHGGIRTARHASMDPFLDVLDLDDGVIDQDTDHQASGRAASHVFRLKPAMPMTAKVGISDAGIAIAVMARGPPVPQEQPERPGPRAPTPSSRVWSVAREGPARAIDLRDDLVDL